MDDRTEIVVLLDRSGSMETAAKDHEGGLNSFVRDQKDLAGDVRFTFIQFDSEDPCEVVCDGVPIADVKRCKLIPRGGTPLLDAVGRSVAHVRERLEKLSSKPGAVIFMVITDGEENSSREFTKDAVKALVTERETGGWKFLFLGANIDAFHAGGGIGVARGSTSGFANNAAGTQSMYGSVSANVMSTRRMRSSGADLNAAYSSLDFTDDQREAAMASTTPSVPPTQKGKKRTP